MADLAMPDDSCARSRTRVSLDLDGELSEFEYTLLTAHLAHCSACREFGLSVRAATAELRAAPCERLERQIALPRRRPPRLSALRLATPAAAVVLTCLALVSALETTHKAPKPHFRGPTVLVLEDDIQELRDVRRLQNAPSGTYSMKRGPTDTF